ncbi:hypothetical protein CPU12_02985 [Malaciobacter molluscorum LMG 25693]|uniref:Iron transporter n=1 Tax=Malaciobacter molluscorum LMG 25693 TaxID=870501 RepID=A0A2G1DKU6_9BACT|nr:hypothetical protein CPU12_02985 [Malaciobacter molluscorum LMG 25693]RXJ94453.1 hypothetical protein CRV00_07500 [Malaciobacter molluscorum]
MKKYKQLSIIEKTGKKIGLFRTICSIFGGLIVAYLSMCLLVFIIPGTPGESIIIPLMFNTFVWAITSLWICLSKSKLIALKRVIIPTVFLSILILFFILGN